jgi:hypothetical protein
MDRLCALEHSTSADGIFDQAVLDDLTAGDAALVAAVLDDFIASTRTDLESLDAAIGERDAEEPAGAPTTSRARRVRRRDRRRDRRRGLTRRIGPSRKNAGTAVCSG